MRARNLVIPKTFACTRTTFFYRMINGITFQRGVNPRSVLLIFILMPRFQMCVKINKDIEWTLPPSEILEILHCILLFLFFK